MADQDNQQTFGFQRQSQAVLMERGPEDYASLLIRAGALLIDLILLSLFIGAAAMLIVYIYKVSTWADLARNGLILTVLWSLAYQLLMDCSSMQGTIGMAVCGLVVTTLDGQPLTLPRSLFRTVASILSYVTCGIGSLTAIITKKKQTVHDLISGTVVVRGGTSNFMVVFILLLLLYVVPVAYFTRGLWMQ